MKSSPCNNCEDKDRDKNHPDCVACKKRIEYNNSLGSHSESVPIEIKTAEKKETPITLLNELEHMTNQNTGQPEDLKSEKDQFVEDHIKTICENAGMTVEQIRKNAKTINDKEALQLFHETRDRIIKSLASGDFGKLSQSKIGEFLGVSNHTISVRMGILGISPIYPAGAQRKPRGSPKKKKTSPRDPAKTLSENPEFNLITIDFRSHQAILEKIREIAEKELRTPKNQILYWLINCDFKKMEKG